MLNVEQFTDVFKHNAQSAKHVQQFLGSLTFTSSEDPQEQGLTWLEFYIIYKLAGFRCVLEDPSNKAFKKPSMGAQLQEFQRTVKAVAKNSMEEEDRQLFGSSECKDMRLKGCGIFGHMAMMKCQIVQAPVLVRQVCFHIAKSKYGRNDYTIHSFLDTRVSSR